MQSKLPHLPCDTTALQLFVKIYVGRGRVFKKAKETEWRDA